MVFDSPPPIPHQASARRRVCGVRMGVRVVAATTKTRAEPPGAPAMRQLLLALLAAPHLVLGLQNGFRLPQLGWVRSSSTGCAHLSPPSRH